MILLLQSTLERVYGAFLVYGVFIAVVIYFIRKQIKKPDKDPLKVIVKWTVSLMVLTFMGFSALTAKGLSFLIVFIVAAVQPSFFSPLLCTLAPLSLISVTIRVSRVYGLEIIVIGGCLCHILVQINITVDSLNILLVVLVRPTGLFLMIEITLN